MASLDAHAADVRFRRIGKCKVCGEAVLWAMGEYGNRVPLDPVPVVDDLELPGGALFISKGTYRVHAVSSDATIYRLHNDGECIRSAREN